MKKNRKIFGFKKIRNIFFVGLISTGLLASNPSIVYAQNQEETNAIERSVQDNEDVVEINNYINEEGKEVDCRSEVIRHINSRKQDNGLELLDESSTITKEDMQCIKIGFLNLTSETYNVAGTVVPAHDYDSSWLHYFGYSNSNCLANNLNAFIDFGLTYNRFNNLQICNFKNEDTNRFIEYLEKNSIEMNSLEIQPKEVLHGSCIEALSNIPGLTKLTIDQYQNVPIDATQIGITGTLQEIKFYTEGYFPNDPNDSIMFLSTSEQNILNERGIKYTIQYNEDQLAELNKSLDNIVSKLYADENFKNLSEKEKCNRVLYLINKYYTYQYSYKWGYSKGPLTPIIDPNINGTNENTGARYAQCSNYAGLFCTMWERIGGKSYYIIDALSNHAYCLVYMDEAFYIVDPTATDRLVEEDGEETPWKEILNSPDYDWGDIWKNKFNSKGEEAKYFNFNNAVDTTYIVKYEDMRYDKMHAPGIVEQYLEAMQMDRDKVSFNVYKENNKITSVNFLDTILPVDIFNFMCCKIIESLNELSKRQPENTKKIVDQCIAYNPLIGKGPFDTEGTILLWK